MALSLRPRRVVVTGLGVNTPLGDDLDTFYRHLLEGRSAITKWRFFDDPRCYSKVGGDLTGYDTDAKLRSLEGRLPPDAWARARKLLKKAPFSTAISMLCAADAWTDAGLGVPADPFRQAVLVGGHNLNERYLCENLAQFEQEPDWIDSMAALSTLDTDHAGSIGDVLGTRGALYTVGGACASTNVALRSAMDEIRHHDHDVVVVAGSPLDFSVMGLHAMALMGAITFQSFNDEPERASRPYDVRREGFVPSHGAGAMVLEELEHARARGARIYAEVLGCSVLSDGSHLPTPSPEGQTRTLERLFRSTGVRPDEVDFVCAHATSTPLGDLSELAALRNVLGDHARKVKINAPKSMLGHTCWSAPVVETIAGLLQMKHGKLHPTINVEELDPEVDLDVCKDGPVEHRVDVMLKNSFGFGGINCCALYRRFDTNGE